MAHISLLVLFVVLFLIAAGWLYLRQRQHQQTLRDRMALQQRILERFESPQQFAEFLDSDGGLRFLASLTDDAGRGPARRVLWSVQAGIVLCAAALAFVVLALMQGRLALAYPAAVLGSLGIGFLASAFVSHRLSRRWGLMPEQRDELPRHLSDDEGAA